jgi:hypothetical protein
MATRLVHAGADPEEADAEIVAGVLDALDHRAIGSERVASSICWHAYRRARRHLGLNRPADLSLEGMAIPPEAPSPSISANPEEVLVVAVRAGVIAAADAELLASNRLDGRTLDELAPDFEVARDTLKKRRVRAENRILALLDDSPWGVVPLRGRIGYQWQRALARRGTGRGQTGRYHSRPYGRIGEARSLDPSAALWSAPDGSRTLAGAAA